MDIPLGLTYDDVLLVPKRSPLQSRSEAELQTRWTKHITLPLPFVSANMATVTEHRTAIALAREGGMGVIHQFGTIAEQVEEVKKVKRSTSYVIEHPLSVSPLTSVQSAISLMEARGVTSLLIVQGDSLVGIFTSRDYLFETNLDRPVGEVITPRERLITASSGIQLDEAKKILHTHRIEKLPLLDGEKITGLITTQDIKKLEYWPHAARDTKGRLMVSAAVGVKDTLERADALIQAGVDSIVLDIAHAHSDFVIERIKELKHHFTIDVMVGNIATSEAAFDLIQAGADGLKVGIGPSGVCTTRIISGAGYPQLSAIMNVCKVAKEYSVPVTADGGMKYPGDISKAIAAGASSIFSGFFFAGTDEAPGPIILRDGKRYKAYAGSASYDSNHKRREHDSGKQVKDRLDVFVEGVASLVDYRGSVSDVVRTLAKGLQSGLSYCGARTIPEMQANASFVQITTSGWVESGARGMKTSE